MKEVFLEHTYSVPISAEVGTSPLETSCLQVGGQGVIILSLVKNWGLWWFCDRTAIQGVASLLLQDFRDRGPPTRLLCDVCRALYLFGVVLFVVEMCVGLGLGQLVPGVS